MVESDVVNHRDEKEINTRRLREYLFDKDVSTLLFAEAQAVHEDSCNTARLRHLGSPVPFLKQIAEDNLGLSTVNALKLGDGLLAHLPPRGFGLVQAGIF